jgi:hypothetical protein
MIPISLLLFPDFSDKISTENVRKSLDLVESIVAFSKGQTLDRKKVKQIYEKLGSRIQGTKIYPGGSSTLFAWSFHFGKVGSIVFKPYYNRELAQLIIHYFIAKDYKTDIDNIKITFNNISYHFNIPAIVGIAKIKSCMKEFPVLLVTEVYGDPVQLYPPLIKNISQIIRKLAKKGIICDPYPANWIVSTKNDKKILNYIDLLSSNHIKNIKERLASIIEKIEKY